MCAVTYPGIAMAIDLVTFLESFDDFCLFAYCPGGRWGNTEQVVTKCQHSVASGVALDMLHRVMLFVLLPRINKAFETSRNGGAFVHHC
jgi:hypothetical protein